MTHDERDLDSPLYKAPVSSPPDKKVALNYNHSGALNDQSVVGVFKMRNYLQLEQFLNLELPKLMEKEKERVSDGDIDLTIQTSKLQKVQLAAWTRFCSLYQSGKIHIRVLTSRKSSPVMLEYIIYYFQFYELVLIKLYFLFNNRS